ncbi:multiple epidermal growth factor-like domains protein 10, partial [Biomphalaria glabrata]
KTLVVYVPPFTGEKPVRKSATIAKIHAQSRKGFAQAARLDTKISTTPAKK